MEMNAKPAYVLTRYKGNLEEHMGVYLDVEKLKEKVRELFMERLAQELRTIGASATPEEMMEVAHESDYSWSYFDPYLCFCFDKTPNGRCALVGEHWCLHVDRLPLLG